MHANPAMTGGLMSLFRLGLFFPAVLMSAFALAQQKAVPIDKIIAIVDDDVVLQSELDTRMAAVEQQLNNVQGPRPSEEELRKQVLDQLIIENLQLQMAARAGVRIDDNQLNQAMASIAKQNNMSFEDFRQALERQNVYLDTREQLRKDIIIQQFQTGAVNNRIDITRQEVENFLRSEAGQADIAPEYRVGHILIENDPGPGESRRKELADFLYKQLADGANILELAGSKQVMGIPISGGDLGWRKEEDLPSIFKDVVPDLKLGEISKPFTSPNGLHIVQLLDLRGGVTLELQQYHVRHILIRPNEIRTEKQSEDLINELYQRIQNGEDFGDIARQHTDDDSSIVAGGDLDWITFGQYPPDFLAVVQKLKVGEMSKPVRLETGWHIIQLLDQRMEDMTEENMRYRAEQILRKRKFENELQNWLTELRDTAYIDIKTE